MSTFEGRYQPDRTDGAHLQVVRLHQQNGQVAVVLGVDFGYPTAFPNPL
jgi:hypothetical protein